MAGVAVVTDSTASLGPERAERAEVRIIPLQVVVNGITRLEGDPGTTPALVAAALRAGQPVTTSRPAAAAFDATYAGLAEAGYEQIVSVHLSGAMSGTCDAARLAASRAPVPVTVVDTRTLTMGTGFAALAGAAAAASGKNAERVAAAVTACAAGAVTYFSVDQLDHLRRGGRIGAAAALLGAALAVKPLLTVADGVIKPYERVRTASRALARLEELGLAALARAAGHSATVDVAVHHLDNLPGARTLVERLQGRVSSIGDISVSEVSAVIGVHVGPGMLGVVIAPRYPVES